MRFFIFPAIFSLLFVFSSLGTSQAAYEQVDPENARKIGVLNIEGANLLMPMGSIITQWEKLGYKLRCEKTQCMVKQGAVFLTAGYSRIDPVSKTAMDKARPPTMINYTANIPKGGDCSPVMNAIKLFCIKGENAFPCRQSRNHVTVQVRPNLPSSDGYAYMLEAKYDPPNACHIKVERAKRIK